GRGRGEAQRLRLRSRRAVLHRRAGSSGRAATLQCARQRARELDAHRRVGSPSLGPSMSERSTSLRRADPANGYPRPQLQRDGGSSPDGPWKFALDVDAAWSEPSQVPWSDQRIVVPFAPESKASGVGNTGFFRACWYQRALVPP